MTLAAHRRRPRVLVVRRGGVSARVRVPGLLVGLVAGAGAVAVALGGIALGQYPMPLSTVLGTLAGSGTAITYDIVVLDRLPRAVIGLLVGAAFAVSGAVLQRSARNPLVSPDVIGVNAGASAGAVVMILGFGAATAGVTGGALLGALAAAALVHGLAHRNGFSGYRLVLVGIGVAAMSSAAATFMLSRADINAAYQAAVWLVGNLAGRGWPDVVPVAVAVGLLLPVALALVRHLALLELGDDLAHALSPHIARARLTLLVCAVGLAALAVAAAGPVGFVALVAPQIARRLLDDGSPGLLPCAAIGALTVASTDLVARTALAPRELPVGVLTALLGAPVLIVLLVRANRIGASG